MLEKVKEVLISQKEIELYKKKQLEEAIDALNKEEKQDTFIDVDKRLQELETEIDNMNITFIRKVINSKKTKKLYEQYREISKNKISRLDYYKNKREELLSELYTFTRRDDALIEQEIIRIHNAKTLDELGLTEAKAIELLTEYNYTEPTIIQKVFSKVAMSKPKTRDEIFKIMQNLYQTNTSAFTVTMKNTSITDIVNELLEMNIIIDEDKLNFLKQLDTYVKSSNKTELPNLKNTERTDRLDNYYWNEVEKAVSAIKRYPNPSSTVIAQITTLSAIVSIAKQNKKEKENHK